MKLANIALLLDASRGVYIPQNFAEEFEMPDWHVSDKDAAVLRAGPNDEWYWGTWDHVLDTAYFLADDGRRFTLHHDGDLWAICVDALTADEYRSFFGENRD